MTASEREQAILDGKVEFEGPVLGKNQYPDVLTGQVPVPPRRAAEEVDPEDEDDEDNEPPA